MVWVNEPDVGGVGAWEVVTLPKLKIHQFGFVTVLSNSKKLSPYNSARI